MYILKITLVLAVFCSILTSCNNHESAKLELADLPPDEVDSISIVNSNKELDSIPGLVDTAKGLKKGSIGDEWKKYFTECLKSDIDSKISYVSMTNTTGPGVLIDTKLGLNRKDIKSILSPEVYRSLIDSSGNSPVCTLTENDYRLIGGYFKATILNLLHINPSASGTKIDTIIFNLTKYKKIALNGGVLDSLYEARESNPALKSYFDDFSHKKVSLIIKGYVISGFNADIKFGKLDTLGLDVGLDSGLVKNVSAELGFKLKKNKNNTIAASSTADFIPLVQMVRIKEIQ